METPKTQTAEVLYELLHVKKASRKDIMHNTGILNVTARISDLRRLGLTIVCEHQKTTNKHGRRISYGSWSLPETEKEKAREIYRSINQ